MATSKECHACARRRYTKYAHDFMDEETAKKYLADVEEEVKRVPPHELETAWERVTRRYMKTDDIHRDEKEKFQSVMMSMKDEVEKMLDESEDILDDSLRYAIAGNVIDFATMPNLTLDQLKDIIRDVQQIEFDPDIYQHFIDDLVNAKNVVLLLDNVGEVVMDTLLCKKLKMIFPEKHITAVPSGYPISSDATAKECYESGMAEYADIIPNGTDICGTYLPDCSPKCIQALDEADIIISKGMANFEVMAGSKYNVYYFFLCKCAFYCEALDAEMMQPLLLSDRLSNLRQRLDKTWIKLGKIDEEELKRRNKLLV